MRLQFINHSCFIVEEGDVKLICDPWIEGRVFNEGWDLIYKTPFSFDDFKSITHIWFSHEHPDHFFPPNIQRIDPEVRKKITVLFQETQDKRVVNFCRKLGFKEVIELKPDVWLPLNNNLKVLCEHYQEGDSWILFRTKEYAIFNTNDCGIRDRRLAKKIKQKVGKVDVLLTQFSYAYWAGNADDKAYRQKVADEKLEGYKFQCEIFEPKYTIPIASFVWFCHEENSFLNDCINRPQKVYDFLKANTKAEPVILYPGEYYTPGEAHDSQHSIEKLNHGLEQVMSNPQLVKGKSIEHADLISRSKTFAANLKRNYGIYVNLLKPAKIFIADYGESFSLSVNEGLTKQDFPREDCDIELSSESLDYCFSFPWGNDTLGINGRYQRPKNGTYSRFYNFFRFDQLKSRGIQPDLRYFISMAVRRALVKAGISKV
jgi:L-ascorbate metabolism protein UlaG (beta-lactamase superfamily)